MCTYDTYKIKYIHRFIYIYVHTHANTYTHTMYVYAYHVCVYTWHVDILVEIGTSNPNACLQLQPRIAAIATCCLSVHANKNTPAPRKEKKDMQYVCAQHICLSTSLCLHVHACIFLHAHIKHNIYVEYACPGYINTYCMCIIMSSRMHTPLPRL